MQEADKDFARLTIEFEACEQEASTWVRIYEPGESGITLVKHVEVQAQQELQLPPNIYLVNDVGSGKLVVVDLTASQSAHERVEIPRRVNVPDGSPPPPDPAFELIRAEAELVKWVDANAPYFVLGATIKRHAAVLGVLERDANGKPRVEVVGEARIVRGTTGVVIYTPAYGAHAVYGPIYLKWQEMQQAYAERGIPYWAYPTSAERDAEGGTGRCQFFKRLDLSSFEAAIYWSVDSAAHVVQNPFFTPFGLRGFSGGPLGFPIEDASQYGQGLPGDKYPRQVFQHGRLFQPGIITGTSEVFAVTEAMYPAWSKLGAEEGIGVPVSNAISQGGAVIQHFALRDGRLSTLIIRAGATFWLWGLIRDRWVGDRRSAYGWPTSSMEKSSTYWEAGFENYYVQWNGGPATNPGTVYIETPLKKAPAPPSPMLTQLNRAMKGPEKLDYYQHQALGTYQDLLWPGGAQVNRLRVGNAQAINNPNNTNVAVLKPGEFLGPSRFQSFYGQGADPTIVAVPINAFGQAVLDTDSIGVGLVGKF